MRTLINYRRNNPWTVFNDGVLRLFDDFAYPSTVSSKAQRTAFPKCDVEETDKYFLMSFDLPGVKKEQLNVEVKEGVMTVSGERKNELKQEGYSERFYGSFERNFSLPESVDAEKIEAHYENGVLRVVVPKSEAKASKRIEIGHGENSKGLFSKVIDGLKKEDQEIA